jgi:chemotaxis protein MotB
VNHERWLVSYADFITLLFAFFVVMYSSSQVDQRKIGKIAVAIQTAFQQLGMFPGGVAPGTPRALADQPPGNQAQRLASISALCAKTEEPGGESDHEDVGPLRRELESVLAPEIARREVALRRTSDGLVISLREIGFFESGSAELRPSARPAFMRIVKVLVERPVRLRIEGHTDNVPIHNGAYASNWELSTARATELVQFLITKGGFAPDRLSAAGYAEFHPVASNDSEQGRAQNRRVDLVILGTAHPAHVQP